jgi:hypothetical protein
MKVIPALSLGHGLTGLPVYITLSQPPSGLDVYSAIASCRRVSLSMYRKSLKGSYNGQDVLARLRAVCL